MLQVIGRFHAAGIESMRDVVYMDVHQRHDLLEMDTHKMYACSMIADHI
jgi:hypothetical protein